MEEYHHVLEEELLWILLILEFTLWLAICSEQGVKNEQQKFLRYI